MYVYLPTWRHRGTRGSRGPPSRLAAASRGGSNAADDDQEPEFDIDDLAKRLSFEAARLRSSLDGALPSLGAGESRVSRFIVFPSTAQPHRKAGPHQFQRANYRRLGG